MNFKTISIIFAVFSFDLLVLSSPVNKNKPDTIVSGDGKNNLTFEAGLIDVSSEEETLNVDITGDDVIADDSSDEEITNGINENGNKDENVCQTKECLEVSNKILSYMDTDVNPCDDFYQFSCGNWIKENPDDQYGTFNGAIKNNIDLFVDIMKQGYKPDKSLSAKAQEYDKIVFNKLKNYFDSCINEDKTNERGVKPLIDFIERLKIDENKDKFKDPNVLTKTIIDIQEYNIDSLFQLIISRNNEANKIEFTFGDTGNIYVKEISDALLSLIYKDEEKMEVTESIINFFKNLYGEDKVVDSSFYDNMSNSSDPNKSMIKNRILKSLNKIFKNKNDKMNKFTNSEEDELDILQDEEEKHVTLKYLTEICPSINWKLLITKFFEGTNIANSLTDSTEVIISNESFFINLDKVLKEVDGNTLSYYFKWCILFFNISLIPKELIKPVYDILDKFGQSDQINIPVIEKCYREMNIPLEKAVARYFVLNNFKNDKKNFTEKVLTYIKQSMYNRIPQIEWLDDETIEYAYKKLNSITEIIGYSEKFIDPEYLFKDFEGLEMTDDYITNSLNVKRFTLKKVFKILDLNNNEIDFGYNAEDVNAYYSLYKNSIFIPAGILQPPFFDQGLPDYINYGGIGSVVGHELTHAFDNDGKDYDINGNKSQWWTDNDIEEFEDNAQCFVNQYEKYSIKNKNGKVYYVLGENTLGENLADNGGLARAYESWKLSLKEDPEQVKKANQLLPGLSSYTMDQLFFITYGQLWCDIEENKEAFVTEYLMLLDVHSPNSARVRGVISNSKEFAKAFNCPAETSMNPKNKCQLW